MLIQIRNRPEVIAADRADSEVRLALWRAFTNGSPQAQIDALYQERCRTQQAMWDAEDAAYGAVFGGTDAPIGAWGVRCWPGGG